MAEKVKDANLQEKEVQVVHGDIYADDFKDRETGKSVKSGVTPEENEWISKMAEIISLVGSQVVIDGDLSIDGLTSKGIANTGGFANIGDVAISGNLDVQGEGKGEITANKISQRVANWEIDLKSILNTAFFKDTSNLYAKLCLLGNELELVISGKFIAKADANTYKNIFTSAIDIPDEIAEKIFRADGTSLKENKTGSGTYDAYITAFKYVRSNPTIGDGNVLLQSQLAKSFELNVYNFGATNEDDVCFIDLRVQLVII